MDPFTLFALANGAVQAVKKGCQLYKDIKSATGDVKGVLKDLDEQFHKKHPPDKPATSAQIKQLNEEKSRVKELNKRSEETTNIYQEIGDYLGQYYDNYFKCLAVLEEEEKRSKTEVYTGDASLAKRALQRILMMKQLEQMGKELRELMIYQSPPELGALFTEVEAMTKELGKQQKDLITKKMQQEAIRLKRRKQRMTRYQFEFAIGVCCIVVILVFGGMMAWVAHDAQQRWGSIMKDKPYQTRLAEIRKQEWFERQKKLKDYEEFLAEKERKKKENESSN
jgi:hypothetical protein